MKIRIYLQIKFYNIQNISQRERERVYKYGLYKLHNQNTITATYAYALSMLDTLPNNSAFFIQSVVKDVFVFFNKSTTVDCIEGTIVV